MKKTPIRKNPYTFRAPLSGGMSFVGREGIITEVYRGLVGGEFRTRVSLFGARNIGTTSLLLTIANPEVQARYLGKQVHDWKFVFVDLNNLHHVTAASIANLFLAAFEEMGTLRFERTEAPLEDVSRAALEIAKKHRNIVLLLDEVDRLLELKEDYGFMDRLFYFLLNASDRNWHMVTASKRPLYELFLTCQGRFGDDVGSPYFVHFLPVMVGQFTPQEVRALVVEVSEQAGLSLADELRHAVELGGSFPHFLQMACSFLFEAKCVNSTLSKTDLARIRAAFEDQARPYYEYFWNNFSQFERLILMDILTKQKVSTLLPDSREILKEVRAIVSADLTSGSFPPAKVEGYFRVLGAYQANNMLQSAARPGAREGEEFSEWLWTILTPQGNGNKVFSTSFSQFLLQKFRDSPRLSILPTIPRLLALLHSNLRRHFEKAPPAREEEVQRAVQLILDASGEEFIREGEQFIFSIKGWRPDHSSKRQIAIEVKLCRERSDVKKIIEEISADILPYRSAFEAVVMVIYDLGCIHDEIRFRRDFEKFEGVYVLIRKH
jgi:hypothetical protein